MIFLERIRELFLALRPKKKAGKNQQQTNNYIESNEEEAGARANPWTRDLERFHCYTSEKAEGSGRSDSAETKIQLLMEQARLEKAKEMLKQQQQLAKSGETTIKPASGLKPEKRKTRTCDATITDGKAWWGEAVATWNPEDAKNLGPQGEIKHPRQHKWFNQ